MTTDLTCVGPLSYICDATEVWAALGCTGGRVIFSGGAGGGPCRFGVAFSEDRTEASANLYCLADDDGEDASVAPVEPGGWIAIQSFDPITGVVAGALDVTTQTQSMRGTFSASGNGLPDAGPP